MYFKAPKSSRRSVQIYFLIFIKATTLEQSVPSSKPQYPTIAYEWMIKIIFKKIVNVEMVADQFQQKSVLCKTKVLLL